MAIHSNSKLGRERDRAGAASSMDIDRDGLAAKLRRKIRGEVRFDAGSRALYAADASNYRQPPIGVVIPKDAEDIIETVALARRFGAPIVGRGGGTSLAGQCCNTAIVIDTSKHYNQILELDIEGRRARVQTGIVLDELRSAAERHGLTFGPDPATHNRCTLGGMINNNSCGVHSVMAEFRGGGPRTSDNLEALEILTSDGHRFVAEAAAPEEIERIIREGGRRGEIYGKLKSLRDRYADRIREKYPKIPRRVSGYNLDDLLPERGFHVARALSGSEGTCVTMLEATLRLVPNSAARCLLVIGYPSVFEAGDDVPAVMEHRPIGLEGLDSALIDYMKKRRLHVRNLQLLPEGKGWLVVEFGGDTMSEAAGQAEKLMAALKRRGRSPAARLFTDAKEQARLWEVRESGLGATAFVPGMKDAWPGWEDSAVPPERVGEYLRDLRELFRKFDYHAALYGHFGQGCIHCRIDFDLASADGLKRYREFVGEAARLVLDYGGSLSGEHGDGQARGELLPMMFGAELTEAFREFKGIWDPEGIMNPGKVVDPNPILSNLRLGADYNPARPETHFHFPEDGGDFSRAALRCVGVGLCRRSEGGTMCPSYMVTREEEHSTRGRARLLFEMLQGDVIRGGWRDPHVKEALDLCLACKGCKSDCPVNVDMATYKAEFLSHYYNGRLRPRAAYSMGMIYWSARLASWAPDLANFFTQTPPFSSALKWAGGVAADRKMPAFARQTFKEWFRQRRPRNVNHPRVILWPDTFCNHFHPHILKSATDVLEEAGFHVVVPRESLCCGRPLYDFGMLPTAKRLLARILEALRPFLVEGVPVVGLEPSCVAVFRDELCNLFPNDDDARRLREQTHTLGEFLQKRAEDFKLPEFPHKAVAHGHCHHKSIMGMDAEQSLLERMNMDCDWLDSGCCGMAGSFGFEADKYEVSVRCGERSLLPSVRSAAPDTLIIADGFSCREQIEQLTDRHPVHTAEVIQMALNGARDEAQLKERAGREVAVPSARTAWKLACAAAFVAGTAGGLYLRRRSRR